MTSLARAEVRSQDAMHWLGADAEGPRQASALMRRAACSSVPVPSQRLTHGSAPTPPSSVYSGLQASQANSSQTDCEEATVPNREKLTGNNLSAENGRPRAFRMTQREWRMECSRAFREFVGDRPGAAKALADEIECSPKTAQSWLDGESTPAGILDLRAMSRVPSYAALKREIAQMETTLDPRLQAKYQELHALTLALANGPRG